MGSFGRGEADEWSDLDLLVVTSDADFGDYERARNEHWSSAELFIDARRNAPAGARSAATVHVRSGLPIWVDWYTYPLAMAALPSDCLVRYDCEHVPRADEPFADWNSRGPREKPLDTAPHEKLHARLAMVPIAGKYIARRSAQAQPMLAFLGAGPIGNDPAQQPAALRQFVEQVTPDCPAPLASAVESYLSLVATAIA